MPEKPQRGINVAFPSSKGRPPVIPIAAAVIPGVLDESSPLPANSLLIDEEFDDTERGPDASSSANARTLKPPQGAPLIPCWLYSQDAPDWPSRLARLNAINRKATNKQLLAELGDAGLDVPGKVKLTFNTKPHYLVYLDDAIAFAHREAVITEGAVQTLPLPLAVNAPDPHAPLGATSGIPDAPVGEIAVIPGAPLPEIGAIPGAPLPEVGAIPIALPAEIEHLPDSPDDQMELEPLPIPAIPVSRSTSSSAPSLKRTHSNDEGTQLISASISDTNSDI